MPEKTTNNTLWKWARGAAVLLAALCVSCSGGGKSQGQGGNPAAAVNSPPRAANVQTQTAPSSSLVLRVLQDSSDQDHDPLQLLFLSQPAHGLATIENNGTPDNPFDDYILYVCEDSFVGNVRFQYTISDGKNGRATGTVNITVGSGGNNAPLAGDDVAATAMNTAVAINVLSNDSDPDGDPIHIGSVSNPPLGTVTLDDAGTPGDPADDFVVYMPSTNYTGMDSFSYWVGDGQLSTQAFVTINVGTVVPTESICGNAMKGALSGALVQLFPIDDNGLPLAGPPVAQVLTDSNGNWCVNVPLPREALLVRVSGGEFVDETDVATQTSPRRVISLADTAFLETVLPAAESYASVNVYTNAILVKSRNSAAAGSFLGLYAVNRQFFRQAFGWSDDLVATRPSDPAAVNPADPAAARIYGMALGGIANVVNDVAVRFSESQMTFSMIQAVIVDLSDCILDGYHFVANSRVPVSFVLNGATEVMPDDLNLNLAIVRFRNNNLGIFNGTSLAQIDGSVCLGGVDDSDSLPPVFVPDPLTDFITPATGPLTDLLSVVPVPLVSDNIDPDPDVIAIAIETSAGVPILLSDPNVPPGEYRITWRATDSATTPNATERVQRLVITANNTGTLVLSPDSFVPTTALMVTVTDPDLDTNSGLAETATATVRNTATMESELLTLVETGPSTGVFSAFMPTIFGTAAGVSGDGQVVVQAGETVDAQYFDALDNAGNPATAFDDSIVTGGNDGTFSIAAAVIIPGDSLLLTVNDIDLDTNPISIDTATVIVRNSVTNEVETITLTETGNSTGLFNGNLATVFGSGAGTNNDGVLFVKRDDIAEGIYDDTLTGNGGTATIVDVSVVTGGNDGNILLAPSALVVGDLFSVIVSDNDLNVDPGNPDTVSIAVTNGSDVETLLLTETGNSSGVFDNTLATQYGTSGIAEDGVLDIQNTDIVVASYDDALTMTGDTATVTDNATVNGGTNGSIVLSPDPLIVGDAFLITVNDTDLDTDPGNPDTVSITVTNGGETETVILTETANSSGVFDNTLATQYGASGASEDGILDVENTDVVEASYDDALTMTGDTATVTDNATINGGTNGSIVLSPDPLIVGDAFLITVNDTDLDTDPGNPDTVSITVTNGGETETVILTETANSSGVFDNTLATQYGASGASEDGILDVENTDVVEASYDDALTMTGDTATVTDNATINGGTNGSIVLSPDPLIVGDAFLITVNDTDLDTDPGNPDTVSITVTNGGETETVILTETANSSGVFDNTLATQYGASGASEDGILDVENTDVVEASYDDALTMTGDTATVTDNATVDGGVTGTITLTPAAIVAGQVLTITVTDADLDTNPALNDTVSVTVTNATTNESESVWLTETTVSSGVFDNTLSTALGPVGPDNDGVLQVLDDDDIDGIYVDDLTMTGAPGSVTDTATVSVRSADLVMAGSVDDSTPSELQVITYTFILTNDGPDTATNIAVSIPQPAGLTFASGTPSLGVWAPNDWTIASLPSAATASLTLTAIVDVGQLGNDIDVISNVTALDQLDPATPTTALVRIAVSPTGILKTWAGGTGSPSRRVDWDEPNNWSPVGVPTPNDDVVVPNVANQPVLNSSVTVGSIDLANSVILSLNGFNISTSGELDANNASITGPGRVIMSGGRIRGIVPELEITGLVNSWSGFGVTVVGDMTVTGEFEVKNSAVVGGDLSISGFGTIIMQSGSSYLEVVGNMSVLGGDSLTPFVGSPRLVAGTMVIRGDFTQAGHPRSFAARGNHTTIMVGSATQRVNFANPDSTVPALGSRFNELRLAKLAADGPVEFLSDVSVLRDLEVFGWQPTILSANRLLTAGGANVNGGTFDNTRLQFINGSQISRFDNIVMDNMARDDIQIAIRQSALTDFDFINFDNIDFRTWPDRPAGGAYIELDHVGADTPTLQVTGSLPLHGVPWTNTIGSFNLVWGNASNDTDADGLVDADELGWNTNPRAADTDNDGLDDNAEVLAGTDPTNPDSDADGLSDGDEGGLGTSPIIPDSDGDGVGDGLENRLGSGPTTPASNVFFIDAVAGSDVNSGTTWGQALASNAGLLSGPLSLINGSPGDPVYVLYAMGNYDAFALNSRSDIILVGSLDATIYLPRVPVDTTFSAPVSSAVQLTNSTGIHLQSITLTGNSASNGGGLLLDGAGGTTASVDAVVLENSVALADGGGFYVDTASTLTISNAIVTANTAVNGGGGAALGGLAMAGSHIGANTATGIGASDGGGGLLLRNSLPVSVTDSVITGNYAEENGGGLMLDLATSNQTIKNNLIVGNANNTGAGGGIHGGDIAVGPTILIESNTLVWNRTLNNNKGGGLYYTNRFDTAETRNNIIWFNDDDVLGIALNDGYFDQSVSGPIEFNNIELDPTLGADNNQGVDPLFEAGFYLMAGSLSADAGSTTAPLAGLGAPYTTLVSGTADTATVDQGFHYQSPAVGPADDASLVEFSCPSTGQLDMTFTPNLFVNGVGTVDLGSGHLVAARIAPADTTGSVIDDRSTITNLQPDGAGSRLAVDQGNGSYRVSVFDFLVSPAMVNVGLVIDGVNSGIVVQSPPLNSIPGC